jgi:chaperonin GroEL
MGKQIQFDDAARNALRRGVEQLANAVRVTLGPRGRNVVIDRGRGTPTITDDGLAIAREIELENPFENMGVQLLREVAIKTGEAAGDGTTTATVLASSVVTHGLRAIASGHNPIAVKRGIDRAVSVVVEDLRRQSRAVSTRADLKRVAGVSAADDEIGELIAEAMGRVGRGGVITVSEGRGMETTLDVVEGARFDRGYLSPYFVTDASRMEVTLDDALVLLADVKIVTARELLPALELAANMGRPLIVVAEDLESEALATLVVNRLRGTLAVVAVRAPYTGERRREALDDLAVLTGARVYSRESGDKLEQFGTSDFGRVRRVVVDSDTTTLTEGGGRASEIRDRAAQLRKALENSDSSYDRERLETRLAQVGGGVAIVRVGAPTEPEMSERKSRIEDALAATRSAVEEGVVPGGGVALLRAQAALLRLSLPGDERVGVDIVRFALEEPAQQIAENAGEDGPVIVEKIRARRGAVGFDAITGTFRNLERQGILDPTKVTRCALQHAASIGSLVLTTDAIVVDSPSEDEEPPEAEN